MFQKFFQNILLGYLKTQAKHYVDLAIARLQTLDVPVTVDAVTDTVRNLVKARFRFFIPDSIDDAVDGFLTPFAVKVRDLAVKKLDELDAKL